VIVRQRRKEKKEEKGIGKRRPRISKDADVCDVLFSYGWAGGTERKGERNEPRSPRLQLSYSSGIGKERKRKRKEKGGGKRPIRRSLPSLGARSPLAGKEEKKKGKKEREGRMLILPLLRYLLGDLGRKRRRGKKGKEGRKKAHLFSLSPTSSLQPPFEGAQEKRGRKGKKRRRGGRRFSPFIFISSSDDGPRLEGVGRREREKKKEREGRREGPRFLILTIPSSLSTVHAHE